LLNFGISYLLPFLFSLFIVIALPRYLSHFLAFRANKDKFYFTQCYRLSEYKIAKTKRTGLRNNTIIIIKKKIKQSN
jgi:hypothetical protein